MLYNNIMRIRRPSKIVFAMVCLLFWGQYAIAQHNVEHLSHQSAEVCEIYKLTEKSTGFIFVSCKLFTPKFGSASSFSYNSDIAVFLSAHHGPRGPPSIT